LLLNFKQFGRCLRIAVKQHIEQHTVDDHKQAQQRHQQNVGRAAFREWAPDGVFLEYNFVLIDKRHRLTPHCRVVFLAREAALQVAELIDCHHQRCYQRHE
jgi:hypothetical protein